MTDADRSHRCPLCGGANDCLLARVGSGDAEGCWCRAERFPAALLERLPPADRGRACICRACLGAARNPRSGGRV